MQLQRSFSIANICLNNTSYFNIILYQLHAMILSPFLGNSLLSQDLVAALIFSLT